MNTHAVVMVDASGAIRSWDAAASETFGYPASEALGRTLDPIVPEEYRQATGAASVAPWRRGRRLRKAPLARSRRVAPMA